MIIIASPFGYFNEVLLFISGIRWHSQGCLSLRIYVFVFGCLPIASLTAAKTNTVINIPRVCHLDTAAILYIII